MSKEIKKVCVVGGGTMGRQIALNAALHGFQTTVTDSNAAVLESIRKWVPEYLQGRLAKGKLTEEEINAAEANLAICDDLREAATDADLVIEAIIEDEEIKKSLFCQLNEVVAEDTILATNSSFISSSQFKNCVNNPSRLANIHFFNPALVMKLVEVVGGEHTAVETTDALLEFAGKVGKKGIWVRKEIDGFVVNRILKVIDDEALYLVENGIATPEEVDTALQFGLNHPIGPFALMDLTGVDVSYFVAKREYDLYGRKQPGYALLEEKYEKKEWGRKTGKGWYEYPESKK